MLKFIRRNRHTLEYCGLVGFLGVFGISGLLEWEIVSIVCQWIVLIAVGFLIVGSLINGFLRARHLDKSEGRFGLKELLDERDRL